MYEVGLNGVPWFPSHDVQIGVAVGYLVALPIMSIMIYTRFPFIKTFHEITRVCLRCSCPLICY